METLEVFGFFAFIMVIFLWSKVSRLERLLRENGIRPVGAKDLARRLAGMMGLTVTLTLYSDGWDRNGLVCQVLDTDEEWVLVLADEGKKKEREMLLRLDSIKSVKGA
ncbi:MAG TPA: hypothetical protein IAC25_07130 [Candidatus Enterenecus stercoripullorum]|nr:hypothetical protein [Candidatus Enterenecus stercoripullorum]